MKKPRFHSLKINTLRAAQLLRTWCNYIQTCLVRVNAPHNIWGSNFTSETTTMARNGVSLVVQGACGAYVASGPLIGTETGNLGERMAWTPFAPAISILIRILR